MRILRRREVDCKAYLPPNSNLTTHLIQSDLHAIRKAFYDYFEPDEDRRVVLQP